MSPPRGRVQSKIAWIALLVSLLLVPRDAPAPIRLSPEEQEAPEGVGTVEIVALTVTPEESGAVSVAVHVRAFTPSGDAIVQFGGVGVGLFHNGERLESQDACGCVPVRGLLEAARRHGLGAETIDLRNSGDTAGPRDEVVGYGAYVFR